MAQKLLIRNLEEFKSFCDININTNFDTLKPYITLAQEIYIIPLISQAECTTLLNALDGVSYPTVPPSLSSKYQTLLEKTQRCLSFYTMYKILPFLNSSIGDKGVQQLSGKEGNSQPVAQWRYIDRLENHLRDADTSAELLLTFMEENQLVFTSWAGTTSYTERKNLLLASAKVFNNYFNINNSRSTYIALRPFIETAELKFIRPAIGDEYFEYLKEKIVDGNLANEDIALLPIIRKALAYATMAEALPQLTIDISTSITVRTFDDAINKKLAVSKDQYEAVLNNTIGNRDTFVATLKRYMMDNRETYPLYLNSHADIYAQPLTTVPKNCTDSGHFRV